MAASGPVSLRRFEAADAAAVHRWFNNPEATKTLMEQRSGFSLEEAEAWVSRAMDDSGEDRKYAILVEGHEEPVGFTALYGLFRQTAPELGALHGDRGVWKLLDRHAAVAARVPVAGPVPRDVDTWDDYEAVLELM